MQISCLAATGARFADFQPYVPAMDDSGALIFQARLAAGGSGVFLVRDAGTDAEEVLRAAADTTIASHPDRNARGDLCVYATRRDGSSALLGWHDGCELVYVDSRDGYFRAIGPLGPVIDAAGSVGFRAELADSRTAVCLWEDGVPHVVAASGVDFQAFHGLPVVAGAAGMLFRADRSNGVRGLYRSVSGAVSTVLESGSDWRDFSLFPAMNSRGVVACGAVDAHGESCVLRVAASGEARAVDMGGQRFDSVRGCLLDDAGELFFTGTPVDGLLGLYRVAASGVERVFGLGSAVDGDVVAGFALNPVSIGARAALAVRVLLGDRRQFIARLG